MTFITRGLAVAGVEGEEAVEAPAEATDMNHLLVKDALFRCATVTFCSTFYHSNLKPFQIGQWSRAMHGCLH